MADVYEFHVGGLIGPVVRAALPELSADAQIRHSVLTGTAEGPDDLNHLLQRIGDAGLTATHILIENESRWHRADVDWECPQTGHVGVRTDLLGAPPVVDDDGPQHHVLD